MTPSDSLELLPRKLSPIPIGVLSPLAMSHIIVDPRIADKFHHNEVLLINQLPDEVLSLVFFFTIVWTLDDQTIKMMVEQRAARSGRVRIRENKPVMHASHVCRHWRVVAMNETNLWRHWSFFDIKNPNWFIQLERRSRGAPVAVRTVQDLTSTSDYILTRHTHRIKSLELVVCGPSPYDSPPFPQYLTYAFPNLESLTLIHGYGPRHSRARFTARFFGGTASNLKQVHLLAVVVNLRDMPFRQIVHLKLDKIEKFLPKDVQALSQLSQLEILEINDCGLRGSNIAVNFTKLRTFSLSGPVDQLVPWHEGLSYPASCRVDIWAVAHKRLRDQHLPVLRNLSQSISWKVSDSFTSKPSTSQWDVSLNKTSLTISNGPTNFERFRFHLELVGQVFNFTSFTYFREYVSLFVNGLKGIMGPYSLVLGHSGLIHLHFLLTFIDAERLTTIDAGVFKTIMPYLSQGYGLPTRPRFFPALRLWEIQGVDVLTTRDRELVMEVVKNLSRGNTCAQLKHETDGACEGSILVQFASDQDSVPKR